MSDASSAAPLIDNAMGNHPKQPPSRLTTTSIAALSAIKIALGASSILAPRLAYSLFLFELKPNAVVVARLFGSSCAALGAATWALNRRVSRTTAAAADGSSPSGGGGGGGRNLELEAERRADLKKVVAFNLAADSLDVVSCAVGYSAGMYGLGALGMLGGGCAALALLGAVGLSGL
ncbi:hypothetical protein JDV02_004767 [Purpureocillium takamizusanense]|uniref:Uncharacterized protein n=1 Tax=Purpureocillium takamizusanense TaxID=2060973 RepID=A0A9Q8V9P8_9HYPO|nr:uncharacterized protein JDV02_004767 [Purpureocillium takamizusanense]UNI18500.1 hypothetical protein JDV02_004767 [Purpureocillium takamizusanense]